METSIVRMYGNPPATPTGSERSSMKNATNSKAFNHNRLLTFDDDKYICSIKHIRFGECQSYVRLVTFTTVSNDRYY
jgi:hypothetical protein